jgi:hypothetical protein
MMKDSTANVTNGRMAIMVTNRTINNEIGSPKPLSLTKEMFELLPVTVVKDFRLPMNHWFTARISVPNTIITNAMIYPYPGFKPFSVR